MPRAARRRRLRRRLHRPAWRGDPASERGYRTRISAPVLLMHPASLEHDTGFGHPERAERIRALERHLGELDWLGFERRESPQAELDALLAVHPRSHVEAVQE